jgi:hypothetical protein
MIVGVDRAADQVARPEIDEFIRPRADRLQIGRRVARFGATIGLKKVFGDEHAARADEGIGPIRRRLLEPHLHGIGVDLLDRDVLIGTDGGCGRLRI